MASSSDPKPRTYRIGEQYLTFDEIASACPGISEKLLRDRLWRGERDIRKLRAGRTKRGVDKPRSWR